MRPQVVYRNLTYSPWRPMSIRQILRTNNGTNVGPNFADSQVFIRRLRYTPYSAQAVADAYRCTSMFACYGPMAPAPTATASTFVSLSATPSLAAGRRALLQQATLQAAALSDAVASVLPGMPADNVTATPSAFGLSMRLTIKNLDFNSTGDALDMYTDAGLQAQVLAGVADDVIPGPGNVLVQSVSEDGTGQMVYVNLLVSGYASYADALTDYRTFTASGGAEMDSTAASLNDALGLITTPYVATAESAPAGAGAAYAGATPASNALTADAILADPTKCPSYPAAWDPTCVNAAGALAVGNANPADDWCDACVLLDVDNVAIVTTYGVTVPIAASAKDSVEAALANSMSTGALNAAVANPATRRRLLQSVTIGNVTVPSQCAPSQHRNIETACAFSRACSRFPFAGWTCSASAPPTSTRRRLRRRSAPPRRTWSSSGAPWALRSSSASACSSSASSPPHPTLRACAAPAAAPRRSSCPSSRWSRERQTARRGATIYACKARRRSPYGPQTNDTSRRLCCRGACFVALRGAFSQIITSAAAAMPAARRGRP